jgi:Bacterial aa3 type cytochrome c oxidase subunit IV
MAPGAQTLRRRCPPIRIALIRRETRTLTGETMAEHNEVAYTTADGNDYEAHEQTYEGFIKLVKYGTAAVAIILALMAIFLT